MAGRMDGTGWKDGQDWMDGFVTMGYDESQETSQDGWKIDGTGWMKG